MGEAINIAGRQRMLSQRIAQSYFLKGLKPDSQRGETQLQRAINEFERNLENLKNYAPAAPIKSQILTVEALWRPYKELALSPAYKGSAEILFEQSNIILNQAHLYVSQLEKLSGTSKGEIINLSGRQRMLSQRIAKNFLALRWGVQDAKATELLYEDLAEYENVLSYLSESELNTPDINTQLSKVKGQFKYASKGFDGAMSLSEQRLIHVVTGTTDAMLQGMNVVTGQYAALLTD
ncbi:pilus assembly protein PilP [Aestuariicella hydrocarbonica]|uniref:Pilus assembly protein PilP n=2 Tax=Pseudomaricurvus hydrocarbonicus TaxID=1470433 RepID=A0A9E5JRL1_9GAMM|nr:pilus assembly protein PilP [Aestuariicella hydrocarbonica]